METYPLTASPIVATRSDPIFIQGILHRSGTNFLHDLLCAHPDCEAAALRENFFLSEAHLLDSFVEKVTRNWNTDWRADPAQLGPQVGASLISFLGQPANGRRLVAKTPSVTNLRHFFRFFPAASLIVLVRDGRAVVESGVRSFNWDYETVMRHWAEAAQTIAEFEALAHNSQQHYLLVRYEDLQLNLRPALEQIFEFLGLDQNKYAFDSAARLPVKGSSELRGGRLGPIHWNAVVRPSNFDSLQRWKDWPRARHERFNAIAGHSALRLGYALQHYPGSPVVRLYWRLWNQALDMRWRARKLASRARRFIARRFGPGRSGA